MNELVAGPRGAQRLCPYKKRSGEKIREPLVIRHSDLKDALNKVPAFVRRGKGGLLGLKIRAQTYDRPPIVHPEVRPRHGHVSAVHHDHSGSQAPQDRADVGPIGITSRLHQRPFCSHFRSPEVQRHLLHQHLPLV
jgi:hypothetical protein